MIVYLLRHGETEYNITKQYTGTLDIPVSEIGLSKLYKADFDTELVYVSPLCRAKQTALALFPGASLYEISDFREMCFGELEGKRYDLSPDKNGAGFASAAVGGEEREGFCNRTCSAFCKLIDSELEKGTERLVIIAHGGTQMAVLSRFTRLEKPYEQWCGKNGGGYKIEILSEKWEKEKALSVLNEVCYSK